MTPPRLVKGAAYEGILLCLTDIVRIRCRIYLRRDRCARPIRSRLLSAGLRDGINQTVHSQGHTCHIAVGNRLNMAYGVAYGAQKLAEDRSKSRETAERRTTQRAGCGKRDVSTDGSWSREPLMKGS